MVETAKTNSLLETTTLNSAKQSSLLRDEISPTGRLKSI